MEVEDTSDSLREERLACLNHLWREYRLEESMWIQKAKVKWIREGGHNTSFFHKICNVSKAHKQIS